MFSWTSRPQAKHLKKKSENPRNPVSLSGRPNFLAHFVKLNCKFFYVCCLCDETIQKYKCTKNRKTWNLNKQTWCDWPGKRKHMKQFFIFHKTLSKYIYLKILFSKSTKKGFPSVCNVFVFVQQIENFSAEQIIYNQGDGR